MKHRITILDTDERYDCGENESLLHAMVRIGRKGIPSGCHGGGCGVCKVQITDGEFKATAMSREHVSEEEQARGIALACRSFPASDLSLKVLGKMQKTVCRQRKYGLV